MKFRTNLTSTENEMFDEAWTALHTAGQRFVHCLDDIPVADINARDLRDLRDQLDDMGKPRLIEKIMLHEVNGIVKFFCACEMLKNRKRKITWPRDANDEQQVIHSVKLAMIGDVAESLLACKYFSTQDIAACYDAIPLEPSNYLFCFRYAGEIFRCKTIPTGHRFCTQLAQCIVLALAREATKTAKGVSRVQVYIDNIRFGCARRADLEVVTRRFHELCSECGLTLNEAVIQCTSPNGAKQLVAQNWEIVKTKVLHFDAQHDFIGMRVDPVKEEISLTDGYIEKLNAVRSELIEADSASVKQLFSWYGKIRFATSVLRLKLAPFYYANRFLRRVSNAYTTHKVDLGTKLKIVQSVKEVFVAWIDTAIRNVPRCVRPSAEDDDETILICTDASLTGWGAIVFYKHESWAFGDAWTGTTANVIANKTASINWLELHTVMLTLQQLGVSHPQLCAKRHIRLLVDNTAAMHCLRKNESKSFFMNKTVGDIDKWLQAHDCAFAQVAYVNTKRNPADYFSRICVEFTTFATECSIITIPHGHINYVVVQGGHGARHHTTIDAK